MNNIQYNEQRYNRKKQWYRFCLGVERFMQIPILNIIWIVLLIGAIFLYIWKNRLVVAFDIPYTYRLIFNNCLNVAIIILSIAVAIVILQWTGKLVARVDEADIILAFDKKDLIYGNPILVHKKRVKKKEVIVREFYSTIPMDKWLERKEAIADVMNVHFIGDIEYGGKANGNRIMIKTAKGRKAIERGMLYDDTF